MAAAVAAADKYKNGCAARLHSHFLGSVGDWLGAVDTVACVTQAGHDVTVLVQVVILGTQIDIDIGVCLVQGLNAFRSSNQADELDPLCAGAS